MAVENGSAPTGPAQREKRIEVRIRRYDVSINVKVLSAALGVCVCKILIGIKYSYQAELIPLRILYIIPVTISQTQTYIPSISPNDPFK